MTFIDQITETRIAQSIARGELDNLPGQGKRLQLEDDRMIPEEYRMAYRLLKNAGLVPPEIGVQKEINALEESLAAIHDEAECQHVRRKLQCLYLKLDNMHGRQINLAVREEYYRKVTQKLAT